MFGFLVVWSVVALFVFGPTSHEGHGEQGRPDGPPDSERSSDADQRWPSAPDVPITTVAMDIPLLNDTMAPPSKVKFSFPKFVGQPAKFPIPTAPTCGITRKAKSAKEVVYMTVDDGPSPSGRLNLLNAMDQLNNSTSKEAAYVTFIESGYNFCGQETDAIVNLKCNPAAYDSALQLLVWTIKAGHMIAAHSDSHFYDARAGFCNYVTMPLVTKVEDKYAKCGKDTWSDMVRGALRIDDALANETLWETDADRAAHKRAVSTLWSYARLPCTNVWRLPGVTSVTGLRKEDLGPERDLRMLTAEKLFGGKLECKPDTKPWFAIGWDAEWRLDAKATYDAQKEKCKVAQDIVNQFDNKWKAGPRGDHVVLLTHDYFFADVAKASIFRDVVAELQLLGYTIGTLGQYPLKQ
ncbi:hypothetical protein DYB30_005129 [Aphanomyces astaci]|uniref:NodB homology domain-containing protein n=1 Tax=Aphanomyces astaci TaxID=112090 RepID=A0A397D248_APHAT|nr:hypothetical protein DYB30_005129 [Aphanomyces astaci]RHY83764.1 hypothetical protein DYB26_001657 [Aphanomyces astaci]